MKTKSVFITAMLCACYCTGQSNVVYYGANSNAISLAFADTNLSELAQSAITEDLQVCLSEWGKETHLSLERGADEPGLIGCLDWIA